MLFKEIYSQNRTKIKVYSVGKIPGFTELKVIKNLQKKFGACAVGYFFNFSIVTRWNFVAPWNKTVQTKLVSLRTKNCVMHKTGRALAVIVGKFLILAIGLILKVSESRHIYHCPCLLLSVLLTKLQPTNQPKG
jgi:hypothetical protein